MRAQIVVSILAVACGFIAQDAVSGAQSPELVLRTGHSELIVDLAFSPNGKLLASVGLDSKIIIWEVATGEPIQTVKLSQSYVFNGPVQFTADGSRLLWSDVHRLNEVAIRPGAAAETLIEDKQQITAFTASKDGHSIVYGSSDGSAYLWDEARRVSRKLPGPNAASGVVGIAFDTTERTVAVGRENGDVIRVDPRQSAARAVVSEQRLCSRVTDLAFNSAGHLIVACADRSRAARPELERYISELWDATTATRLGTTTGVAAMSSALARDASSFAAVVFDDKGKGPMLRAWMVSPLAPAKQLQLIPVGLLFSIAAAPGGRLVAFTTGPTSIAVADVQQAQVFDMKSGPIEQIADVRLLQPNLLATSRNYEVDVWDMAQGSVVSNVRVQEFGSGLAADPSGRWLAYISDKSPPTVAVFDWAKNATTLHHIPRFDSLSKLFITDNGTKLAWIARSGFGERAYYWNLAEKGPRVLCDATGAGAMALSPHGTLLAVSCMMDLSSGEIRTWHIANMEAYGTLERSTHRVDSLAISPDERFIAIGEYGQQGGAIRVMDVSGPRTIQSFGFERPVSYKGLKFGPAGLLYAAVTEVTPEMDKRSIIHTWEVTSGKSLHSIDAGRDEFNEFLVFPDGTFIAGMDSGSANLYHAITNDLVLRLVPLSDGGWVAVAPNGLFDGTSDALRWIGWREKPGAPVMGLDLFYNDFFEPGLAAAIFAEQYPTPRKDLASLLRMPGFGLLQREELASVHKTDKGLVLCLPSAPTEELLEGLNLKAKGKRVPLMPGEFHSTSAGTQCAWETFLPDIGLQDVHLSGLDREPKTALGDAPPKDDDVSGILHVQAVGIDSYPEASDYSALTASAEDACRLTSFFRDTPGVAPFRSVKVWDPLLNADATREALRARILKMSGEVKPNDVVLLFLSGHGSVEPGSEMFYFIPADIGNGQNAESATAVSTAMLVDLLRMLPARRILIVIDACQSGGALDSLEEVARFKEQLQRRFSPVTEKAPQVGVFVIAASLPYARASEMENKGGVLATALLQALQGTSGYDKGVTYASQIANRVSTALPKDQLPLIMGVGADFPIVTAGPGPQLWKAPECCQSPVSCSYTNQHHPEQMREK